ncbi:MAG: hypothetical protein ACK6A5_16370, partial [Flavobacteriales bacterium]
RFTSNASVVNTGWELMVSCGPPLPPAPAINGVCGTTVYDPGGATGNYNFVANCAPPAAPPQDCLGANIICTNGPINVGGTNSGSVGDMIAPANGCLSGGENHGTWYAFSTTTAGPLGFTITPTVPGTNMNFALWGPFNYTINDSTNWSGACEALSFSPFNTPIRCTFATSTAGGGATGLNGVAADLTEGA